MVVAGFSLGQMSMTGQIMGCIHRDGACHRTHRSRWDIPLDASSQWGNDGTVLCWAPGGARDWLLQLTSTASDALSMAALATIHTPSGGGTSLWPLHLLGSSPCSPHTSDGAAAPSSSNSSNSNGGSPALVSTDNESAVSHLRIILLMLYL